MAQAEQHDFKGYPEHPANHHQSRLSNAINSIRHALSREHERSPKDTERHSTEPETTTSINNSASPAIQAVASSKLNDNNIGEGSQQNDNTWGWPGLGTFAIQDSITTQGGPKSPTQSTTLETKMEGKSEATTFKAAGNAAESELYGWAGLGEWSTASRK